MDEEERENADPSQEDETTDDTEGQTLTWKVKKPIPESSEEDVEGQALRPPPDPLGQGFPLLEDDDAEGHGGLSGSPRPPVD